PGLLSPSLSYRAAPYSWFCRQRSRAATVRNLSYFVGFIPRLYDFVPPAVKTQMQAWAFSAVDPLSACYASAILTSFSPATLSGDRQQSSSRVLRKEVPQ